LIAAASLAPWQFTIDVPVGALPGPFSGRVVVYFAKAERPEPRFGPNWFNPQPCYSASFRNARPPFVIDPQNAVGFPGALEAIPPGDYTVQAVVDRNLGGREIGGSPGNLFSKPQKVTIGAGGGALSLLCDQVVPEPVFVETETTKEVKLESKLLSRHYGRPTPMKAAVILPESYGAEPTRRYPVIYSISGFGGGSQGLSGNSSRRGTNRAGTEFIMVHLDANCPTGHSTFADSDNNGPWGKALVTELIPEIERRFRTSGKRLVTGHSSGGWSSLWLQVTYPDFFGGTWSTSPDPVDFRAFQTANIYEDESMFRLPNGEASPLARAGGRVLITYKQFSDMELPIRGEQLGSFDAVFSRRGRDGEPMRLWDPKTGKIDRRVANDWKRYDIGLILRSNWAKLAPKLKGKLHVYMGNEDTFYLEAATKLLQADLKALGSDAKIEIFPGDHGSVLTRELRDRIDREMAAQVAQ
jgi:hypothetical protein